MPIPRTNTRRRPHSDFSSQEQAWALHLLVKQQGWRVFIHRGGFSDDRLANALGLAEMVENDELFDGKAALAHLREQHRQRSSARSKRTLPAHLHDNLQQLSALLGMSQAEVDVVALAVCLHTNPLLAEAGETLKGLSTSAMVSGLADLLNQPGEQIDAALAPEGVLARTGLVLVDHGNHCLAQKLDLIGDHFGRQMLQPNANPLKLLGRVVQAAPPSTLTLADYPHIQLDLDILLPYLRQAITQKLVGVNVYIHGAPGTGKTELARAVAAALEVSVYEVTAVDDDGDAVESTRRLRNLTVAQAMLASRSPLLVFDEAEDAFPTGFTLKGRPAKGWVNQLLEQNPMPTLWLSNSVRCLDPAYARRFDLIFELPIPPQGQRLKVLTATCGTLLDAPHIARLAKEELLAPAIVSRAARVVGSIRAEIPAEQIAPALERLISNTLEAQDHPPLRPNDPNRLPETYDPAFINADTDLPTIAQGLKQAKSGRLCLFGPPGTGKTAYARWLAEYLNQPLMVRRVSDLISKWVGESEQNIAGAFRQADAEGAVLLIDEVDSFLQDRRTASHSWETTLVNEMLTQMESFAGIFIASTNLMQGLDPAALRRFDLKARFDYLRPPQALALLQRQCAVLQLPEPDRASLARVALLRNLTPGVFAAVHRQTRFRPLPNAADWVNALAAECALKENAKTGMGFV